MNDIRDNAIHCEVRKIAYRQSKDGVVVSFVVHPNDVSDHLATADLGSRFMMALVEIGDDEQPTKPEPRPALPRRIKPVAPEKKFAQQAGIACADPVFRRFLIESGDAKEQTEESATHAVRSLCGVLSRTEITPGSAASQHWDKLWTRFIAWRDHDMPASA